MFQLTITHREWDFTAHCPGPVITTVEEFATLAELKREAYLVHGVPMSALNNRESYTFQGWTWKWSEVVEEPAPVSIAIDPVRPAMCGKCKASLAHSAEFALVLPDGTLVWDTVINQPLHHCEACGLELELAGKELMWLPTDAQIQDRINAERQDIGIN